MKELQNQTHYPLQKYEEKFAMMLIPFDTVQAWKAFSIISKIFIKMLT